MNKTARAFKKLFENSRKRLSYFVQGAIVDFTEAITVRMEDLGLSKSELAKRLNCSPSYITKTLRGGTNFTLESMVRIALALDSELGRINLVPRVSAEKWSDILKQREQMPKPAPLPDLDLRNRGNIVQLNTTAAIDNHSDELTLAA